MVRFLTAGESHGRALVVILEGLIENRDWVNWQRTMHTGPEPAPTSTGETAALRQAGPRGLPARLLLLVKGLARAGVIPVSDRCGGGGRAVEAKKRLRLFASAQVVQRVFCGGSMAVGTGRCDPHVLLTRDSSAEASTTLSVPSERPCHARAPRYPVTMAKNTRMPQVRPSEQTRRHHESREDGSAKRPTARQPPGPPRDDHEERWKQKCECPMLRNRVAFKEKVYERCGKRGGGADQGGGDSGAPRCNRWP